MYCTVFVFGGLQWPGGRAARNGCSVFLHCSVSQYDTCCEFRIYYITQGIGSCFYFRVSRIQAFIIRDHFTEEALRGRVPFRQIFCVILAAGYTALALMLINYYVKICS